MVDYRPLGALLSKVIDNRGKTCPTSDRGIPLIATNCVKNEYLYPVHEKVRYVSRETYQNWFRGHPKPGDLIFVLKGSPGRVCLAPDPVDFCIAQDMVALRADPVQVDPSYLFAALRSTEIQQAIESLHVGSLIAHFKKGDFDRLMIPVPDMKTQRGIGHFYRTISDLIELNLRKSQTLTEVARALFVSWFVDFDPVHAKVEGRTPAHMDAATALLFPNRFGDDGLPVGWTRSAIGDFASLTKGRSYKSAELGDSATALITLKSFQRGGGYRTDGLKPFVGPFRSEQVAAPGELVISMTDVTQAADVIARATFVRSSREHSTLVASLDVGIIRPTDGMGAEYLHQILNSKEFLTHALGHVTGTTVLHLSSEAILRYAAVTPPRALISAFQNAASPLSARIASGEQENEALASMRDEVLPRLMSGELRIRDAERALH